MRLKIEIDVEELKDGSFIVKLGDKVLGDADNLDPIEELNRLYDLIKAKDYISRLEFLRDKAPELRKEFNDAIIEDLARLLAFFSVEED
jgi:uncharacterized protein YfkK (UPF0435 family)